jgi:hypothetical protein
MTFPTLGNNCAGGGLTACQGIRTLTTRCTASNDGVNANMLDWINDYDFDVAGQPWNSQWIYDFNDASHTVPDSGPYMYSPGFSPPVVSKWNTIDVMGAPLAVADGWRSQIWLPTANTYGIIAFTVGDSMGWFACCGSVTPCGQVVEIPVPNDSLDGGAPFNRMFYWMKPDLANSTELATFWAVIQPTTTYVNTGTWNLSATCYASPDDPFDDVP